MRHPWQIFILGVSSFNVKGWGETIVFEEHLLNNGCGIKTGKGAMVDQQSSLWGGGGGGGGGGGSGGGVV